MTSINHGKWIARDREGLTAFDREPIRYHLNPYDKDDFIWISQEKGERCQTLDPSLHPEITIENSPKKIN